MLLYCENGSASSKHQWPPCVRPSLHRWNAQSVDMILFWDATLPAPAGLHFIDVAWFYYAHLHKLSMDSARSKLTRAGMGVCWARRQGINQRCSARWWAEYAGSVEYWAKQSPSAGRRHHDHHSAGTRSAGLRSRGVALPAVSLWPIDRSLHWPVPGAWLQGT